MKKIQTSNNELLEILSDNGIEMICNEDMEIVMRFGSKKPTTLAVGGIEPRSFFV